MSETIFSRSNFLGNTFKSGLAFYLATQLGMTSSAFADHQKVISTYTMPDSIEPINIDKIVASLDSHVPVGDSNYLQSFVNLIQSTHKEITGMTIQKHMEQNLGNENPIDVILIKGLIREEDRGPYGIFVPDKTIRGRNKAHIDADMTPAWALFALNHELGHGYNGRGEIVPYGYTHRDIAYMVATHPDLLRENDSSCPLYALMEKYLGKLEKRIVSDVPYVYFSGRMNYLTFLESKKSEGESFFNLEKLDKEFSKIKEVVGETYSLDRKYRKEFIEKAFPNGLKIEVVREMAKHFVDATESYILSNNPNFPTDKRELLGRKIKFFKEYIINEWKT